MSKKKRLNKKIPDRASPYSHLSTNERLQVFANIIVDRIIEEEQIYKEKLKTDRDAKRIYENCACEKCRIKRLRKAK